MKLNLDNVPTKPGVYKWLGHQNKVLYIGKAKNLKKRTKQYFIGMLNSYKTSKLVEQIKGIDFIITNTEKEALILERNLIHENTPPYNILLTDDKRYPYIKISLDKILKISLDYKVLNRNKTCVYFGPFPPGYGAHNLMKLIQKLTIYEKGLPIINKSTNYWNEKFNYAKKLLSSNNVFLIKELKSEMKKASENHQYEIAIKFQESIETLKYNKYKQSVQIKDKFNIDVMVFFESNNYMIVSMLFYRFGTLLSKKQKVFEIINTKQDLIRQFISQYYIFNTLPNFIISNEKIETDIKTIIPKKGEKWRILNIAIENAKNNIENTIRNYKYKEKRTLGAMKSLQKLLNLTKLERIIMIDNSNINNTNPVSGIVSYVNGIKNKNEYRKFKLNTNNRLSDVDYLNQALSKYFSKKRSKIDLLIVDGGIQQINEAKKIVPSSITIAGLVKDSKHKTNKLLNHNGKVINVEDKHLWLFLNQIQIEVDRFAKSYHIKRRKYSLDGILCSINGIGPKTEKKLLSHFKSYSNIYNASLNELKKIVSNNISHMIKKKFNKNLDNFK